MGIDSERCACPNSIRLLDVHRVNVKNQTHDETDLGMQEIVVDMMMKKIDQDMQEMVSVQDFVDKITGIIIGNCVEYFTEEFDEIEAHRS